MKKGIIYGIVTAVCLNTSDICAQGFNSGGNEIQTVDSSDDGMNGSVTMEMKSGDKIESSVKTGVVKRQGKLRGGGLMKCYIDGATAGDCFGYEIHAAKDKRMILDKVGFYYCDGDSSLTGMRFRINVYDMSDVSGDVTDKFVNVLAKPVYFEFVRGEARSGQFEYKLTETVELPKDAMVEIEMLENLNENKLWFNSGLVGKRNWGKSAGDSCWVLTPFSTPFFIDCIEVKNE